MAKTTNPYNGADFFKAFGDMTIPGFDADFFKAFGDVTVPAFDADAMIAAQRKNIETLAAFNEIAVDGVQAFAQRQGEIMRKSVTDYTKASKAVMAAATPAAKAAKQMELANTGFVAAFDNARELSELFAGTAGKAFDLLGKRFVKSLNEVKDLATDDGAAQ